jgi:phenylalanyl-tRNA synthetase beta chain
VDVYPAPIQSSPIRLRVRRIHQILGTEVSAAQVRNYLEDLELEVRGESEDVLVATPPSFRGDLEREIDLIEEVARLNGYDRIPMTIPTGPPSPEKRSKAFLVERKVIDALIVHGYHEVVNTSFIFRPSGTRSGSLRMIRGDSLSESLILWQKTSLS